ncbi:hypothetical protein [Ralstonia pseudosolanacearum]|uniref:Uncharacterized protein n=1 Tax=Ralstonia solanacearum TaxID=305 RepID=A0AA92EG97_RALSL|nr:hypothetical protein [Ralstonia pseudosolanacearum]QCX51470.1 hypothetical protein E7Z57_20735 [Ralstonia pseudosolanacearum]
MRAERWPFIGHRVRNAETTGCVAGAIAACSIRLACLQRVRAWRGDRLPLTAEEQSLLQLQARLKQQRDAKGQTEADALKDPAYTAQLPQQTRGRERWQMWGCLR